MKADDKVIIPAGTPIHIGHTPYMFTLPGPLEVVVADIDTNEQGAAVIFDLPCDVEPYHLLLAPPTRPTKAFRCEPDESAGLLEITEPIPGRAGWRRDAAGREWYSDEWLDPPQAARNKP